MDWLLLIYRVPSDPSRNRVAIWRELKRLGALYLQQSVCILPREPHLEHALKTLAQRIEKWGGQSNLLPLGALDAQEEEKITRSFREARDKDYEEIIEQCNLLLHELAQETERRNFSSAEVEENEENLERLKRWFSRVQARDWFDAARRGLAEQHIAGAEVALEEFAERVYEQENPVERRSE